MFELLWPENKVVSEDTIIGWFFDAIKNDELDIDCIAFNDIKTPQEMAYALHNAGLITLAK